MSPRDPKWKPRDPKSPAGAFEPPPAAPPTRQAPGAVVLEVPKRDLGKSDIAHGASLMAAPIFSACIRDALGLGWTPPESPLVVAERAPYPAAPGEAWSGWFTVGHRRFRVRVELDCGDPLPTPAQVEAEIAAEDAENKLDAAESKAEGFKAERDEVKDELEEAEAKDLRKKLDAWFDTVYEATAGDGAAALECAKKIPKEYVP